MECIDSYEIQNTDDNCFLNDLSTPLTDSEPESDNEDPDMGISVTRPRMEHSDSCYTVTCTVNIAVALLKGTASPLIDSTLFYP